MEKELYKAAVRGDASFLSEALSRDIEKGSNNFFLYQVTGQQNNIVHIAVQHGRLDFLKAALRNSPSLVCQRNSNGDTPLHTASKGGNHSIVKLLVDCYNNFTELSVAESEGEAEGAEAEDEDHQQPWKMKNLQGNTPLHLALTHGKVWLASYLVEVDPEVAGFVNSCNETPLHLAIKYSIEGDKKLATRAIQLINTRKAGLTYKGCPLGESSISIIQLLLQKNSSTACWCDIDHLTPLLKAALKSDLPAIKAIINQCPESVEVCDHNGSTVLHFYKSHYEDTKELLEISEIYAMKDEQDHDGNTPAHVAVKNHNVDMVRALLESSANFTLKNKEGVSAAEMLHQQTDFTVSEKLEISDIEDDFAGATIGKMPGELFVSAVEGDVDFLKQTIIRFGTDYLQSRMLSGRNIIHVACQWHKDEGLGKNANRKLFIEVALESLPSLICQTDYRGNTPLHIIISRHDIDASFLDKCKKYFQKAQEEAASYDEELYCPPWRVKNVDGNTPLHKALQAGYVSNARRLIEFDSEVAQEVNNNTETILHILCQSRELLGSADFSEEDIDFIIEADPYAIEVRDSDGLTPLLKAASYGSVRLAERIINHFPWTVMQCDPNGGTVLHRMAYGCPYDINRTKELLKVLTPLWYVKDKEGNTPLHLAIEKGNFDVAKLFMEGGCVFGLKNNKGVMPGDLLGSADDIPRKFQQFLWKRVDVAAQIFGLRSMRGIPTTEIKGYINTTSVTVALLATITFTAAFAVPGGFDNQQGTPVLARKAGFWVFLSCDILAFCLSMMVLFCLLWIMIGTPAEKVVLLDLSLYLLQASFYATLLTFMIGVYITITTVLSWLAILLCIVCSILVWFMRRSFIMSLVPWYQAVYSVYQLVCYSGRESIRYLKHKLQSLWAKTSGQHHTNRSDEERNSPKFFQIFRPCSLQLKLAELH